MRVFRATIDGRWWVKLNHRTKHPFSVEVRLDEGDVVEIDDEGRVHVVGFQPWRAETCGNPGG